MKLFRILTLIALVVTLFAAACVHAQTRTNQIYRRCSGTTRNASVVIQKTGEIDIEPCIRSTSGGAAVKIGDAGGIRNGTLITLDDDAQAINLTANGGVTINGNGVWTSDIPLVQESGGLTTNILSKGASGGQTISDSRISDDGSTNISVNGGTGIVDLGRTSGAQKVHLSIDGTAESFKLFSFNSGTFDLTGNIQTFLFSRVVTAGGTTGNQTINVPVGTVNFAAGASAITVTSSVTNASSIVFGVIRRADATCTSIKSIAPAAGSFVITLNANCTAETSVGFIVTN